MNLHSDRILTYLLASPDDAHLLARYRPMPMPPPGTSTPGDLAALLQELDFGYAAATEPALRFTAASDFLHAAVPSGATIRSVMCRACPADRARAAGPILAALTANPALLHLAQTVPHVFEFAGTGAVPAQAVAAITGAVGTPQDLLRDPGAGAAAVTAVWAVRGATNQPLPRELLLATLAVGGPRECAEAIRLSASSWAKDEVETVAVEALGVAASLAVPTACLAISVYLAHSLPPQDLLCLALAAALADGFGGVATGVALGRALRIHHDVTGLDPEPEKLLGVLGSRERAGQVLVGLAAGMFGDGAAAWLTAAVPHLSPTVLRSVATHYRGVDLGEITHLVEALVAAGVGAQAVRGASDQAANAVAAALGRPEAAARRAAVTAASRISPGKASMQPELVQQALHPGDPFKQFVPPIREISRLVSSTSVLQLPFIMQQTPLSILALSQVDQSNDLADMLNT